MLQFSAEDEAPSQHHHHPTVPSQSGEALDETSSDYHFISAIQLGWPAAFPQPVMTTDLLINFDLDNLYLTNRQLPGSNSDWHTVLANTRDHDPSAMPKHLMIDWDFIAGPFTVQDAARFAEFETISVVVGRSKSTTRTKTLVGQNPVFGRAFRGEGSKTDFVFRAAAVKVLMMVLRNKNARIVVKIVMMISSDLLKRQRSTLLIMKCQSSPALHWPFQFSSHSMSVVVNSAESE